MNYESGMNYGRAYRQLHAFHQRIFSGYSIKNSVDDIAALVGEIGKPVSDIRLLDYGSGKGYQYLEQRVHERWGGVLPVCYDPGVRQLSARPKGRFDGVICTDVMEHIEEVDVPGVFSDIFSFVPRSGFVMFYISCRRSKHKRLPDPDLRNIHLTVRPPLWWAMKVNPFHRDNLSIRMKFEEGDQ